ncbi:MAG: dipeptidyl peptidase 3 [Bacteroidales bacterium]|nr:dipeptidyl peptidase 3 [Bacteroidales bacterium]
MKKFIFSFAIMGIILSCNNSTQQTQPKEEFSYVLEQFADLRVLRYKVPGFENLSLDQKKLIYFLSQAAVSGRDIFWDQNGKYNLAVRKLLENIYESYTGNRENENWEAFMVYLKRVWFSNGIYHHYSTDKFKPAFNASYFEELLANSSKYEMPEIEGKSKEESIAFLKELILNPEVLPKKVNQDTSVDIVKNSAVNFYENVGVEEVEEYYNNLKVKDSENKISYGLNSKVVKDENGAITEIKWKSGGMYGPAIDSIIYWLDKAIAVADSPEQKAGIEKLIEYYKTGDLVTWDNYNVIWVKDTAALVDFINGFIEVYDDPLGQKATWEAVVNFKDTEATKRTKLISENAQWFEDHSPIDERFKKKEVKGVTAKVINAAMMGGACYPHTPLGINLPNANWIRKEHGSKSVTIANISDAYNKANLSTGSLEEFSFNDEETKIVREFGPLSGNLHTDLHECLGHGSGQMLPGVSDEALRNYHSPLEEARADLFALYYIMDPKLVELGILPSLEAAKAEYITYIRNGIMGQLRRIEPGKNIEQAHMRNRQLIASWSYERGKADSVIVKEVKDGKTYFVINDFDKLRSIFAELLAEVQRIKSEGDYEAGKALVEGYGVKVDPELHKEVLERYKKLNLAAYSGFVNPEFEIVENDGAITDIKIHYVDDYPAQMMKYSKNHSYLPLIN